LRNALQYADALQSAMLDPLTGVGNRIALDQAVSRETDFARRHQHDLSMLVIDLDHFKNINDQLGHAMGDEVLKSTASQIVQCVRRSDLIFRFGGEEFVVLLSKTSLIGAQRLAERMRAAIENNPCKVGAKSVHTTVSIGVAALDVHDDEGALFRRADQALYQAKKMGRNTVFVADHI
jgi:diguanylate cyclase (GGDEF)-like protein